MLLWVMGKEHAIKRPWVGMTQVDEEPAIRANTTILLGNLAAHLNEATCKRVLLNAFTRALKDTFPPARVAGVKVCPLSRAHPTWVVMHTLQHQSWLPLLSVSS